MPTYEVSGQNLKEELRKPQPWPECFPEKGLPYA